jgi:hypothetical protein
MKKRPDLPLQRETRSKIERRHGRYLRRLNSGKILNAHLDRMAWQLNLGATGDLLPKQQKSCINHDPFGVKEDQTQCLGSEVEEAMFMERREARGHRVVRDLPPARGAIKIRHGSSSGAVEDESHRRPRGSHRQRRGLSQISSRFLSVSLFTSLCTHYCILLLCLGRASFK